MNQPPALSQPRDRCLGRILNIRKFQLDAWIWTFQVPQIYGEILQLVILKDSPQLENLLLAVEISKDLSDVQISELHQHYLGLIIEGRGFNFCIVDFFPLKGVRVRWEERILRDGEILSAGDGLLRVENDHDSSQQTLSGELFDQVWIEDSK